jgi:hypothetical protein
MEPVVSTSLAAPENDVKLLLKNWNRELPLLEWGRRRVTCVFVSKG